MWSVVAGWGGGDGRRGKENSYSTKVVLHSGRAVVSIESSSGRFQRFLVPHGAGGLTLVPQLGKGFLLSTCFPLQPLRTGKSSREVPLPLQEAGQDLRRPQRRPWANSTAGIWSEETFLRPVL